MEKLEKDKRIKAEVTRLRKLFKFYDVDDTTTKVLDKAINSVGFMSILLEDLQEDIKANGYKEKYQNGENQMGWKDSVAVRTYNNTIKSYNTLIKTLQGFLPKADGKKSNGDAFAGFLMK